MKSIQKKVISFLLVLVMILTNASIFTNSNISFAEGITIPTLEELNEITYMRENTLNRSVKVYYKGEDENTVPTVTVEKDGVVYGTSLPELDRNKPYAYDIYDKSSQNMVKTGYMKFYAQIFMGSELKSGTYDIVVAVGDKKEVIKDKFIVHNKVFVELEDSWEYETYLDQKKAYARFEIEGGNAADFSAVLYDKDKKVVNDKGQFIVASNDTDKVRGIIEFKLKEELELSKEPYTVELETKKEVLGNLTTEIRVKDDKIYLTGSNTTANDYACFVAWLNKTVTTKVEANIYGNDGKELAKTELDVNNSKILDIQFLDASGNLLKLKPGHYNVQLREVNGRHIGNLDKYIREESSSSSRSYDNYINYDNGVVYTYLNLPADLSKQKLQASKFSVKIKNVVPGKPVIELKDWVIKSESTDKKGIKNIQLEKKIGKEVPRAMYTATAFYDGKDINKVDKAENALAKLWPFEISDLDSKNNVWSKTTYKNEQRLIDGISIRKGSTKVSNLELDMYSIKNIYGEPVSKIALKTVGKDGETYSILKANSTKVDFYDYYFSRVRNNGSIISEFNYEDERRYIADDEKTDTKAYTIKSGDVKNGSISFSKTKGMKYEEITVMVKANAGYRYKSNSIKVNGKAIDGRFFILRGDAVVTAEFEAIQ